MVFIFGLHLNELDVIESEVVQSCPTLSNPIDRSLPGSSIHGIFQARVLEWDAIALSFLAAKISKVKPGLVIPLLQTF